MQPAMSRKTSRKKSRSVVEDAVEAVGDFFEGIPDAIRNAGEAHRQWLTIHSVTGLENAADAVADFVEDPRDEFAAIGNFFEEAGKAVAENVGKVVDSVEDKIEDGVEFAKGKFEQGVELATDIKEAIEDTLEDLPREDPYPMPGPEDYVEMVKETVEQGVEDVKEFAEDTAEAVGDFFGGLFGGDNGAGTATASATASVQQAVKSVTETAGEMAKEAGEGASKSGFQKFSGDGDASDPTVAKSQMPQMELADFMSKVQSPVVVDLKKGLTDNILLDDPTKLKALLGGEPQIKGPDIGPDPAPFAKMAAFEKVDAFDDGGSMNLKMNAQFDFMV